MDDHTEIDESTSGLHYLRYAVSGRNRFVTGIALLAALGGFLFGYDTGIIGQALPYISRDLHPSTIASSWIVASIRIGAMVGAAISGYLAEKISRKWTKCISGCVYVIGALGAAFAQSIPWLIAARVVLGPAVGTASFVAPEYIAEQTPPKIRRGHGDVQPGDGDARDLPGVPLRVRVPRRLQQLALDARRGRRAWRCPGDQHGLSRTARAG